MKILYDSLNEYDSSKHKIYYAIPDILWGDFNNTTVILLDRIDIDEVDESDNIINLSLRMDLKGYCSQPGTKIDDHGEGKYFVNNVGEICENVGWVEREDDL